MKKNILYTLFIAVIIVSACKKDWKPGKALTIAEAAFVSATGMTITLKANTTLQLRAIITPGNDTITNVAYTNKYPNISTINNSGLLTGKAVGRDTLTVTTTDGSNLNVSYVVSVTQ